MRASVTNRNVRNKTLHRLYIYRLGSKSARFARALTFLAPTESFYGYCTLSVTTIQIQHEIRVGRSPDRPEAKPG